MQQQLPTQPTQPAQQMSPSQVQQAVSDVQQKVEARTPMDLPNCFGGASPRKDGGTGYTFDSESCLVCPFDAQCGDACTPAAT